MLVRIPIRSDVVWREPVSFRVGSGAVPTLRRAASTESGVDVHHVRKDPSRAERSVDSDRVSCHPVYEIERELRIAGNAAVLAA
jgi:hypothetical protein